ncbi:MAG: WecB/TagA/CpsF family glycosyltransferase [Candidatus Omnitrophica bacterium]|nr:WecB/TagA/CpsF family glycosyltransferase [Candidatus Omnitrophota bacterium]
MSIIYMSKLLGHNLNKQHRITWVDLIKPLMDMAKICGFSVFYLGSDESTISKGISVLKQLYPGIVFEYRNGFFNPEKKSPENTQVLQQINLFKPNILLVGMGMLRQEKWILENFNHLDCNAIMTCGAAIEYIAGKVNTPPRWMGRTGLEWAYRFFENPKRFWCRYLVEPWFVLGLFMRDICKKYILRKPL